MTIVKTRFSPSPTGDLHIGGIRTAFYSWLYSRHHHGKFVLRIEDTDFARSSKEFICTIKDGMNWLGLTWDEGPYYQTQRLKLYNDFINQMLDSKNAYRCYCSKYRIEKLRKEQISKGMKPKYDEHCRNKIKNFSLDKNYVIRFRNPKKGAVMFRDRIRGLIKFNNSELDDLIICRADGIPTYNFCSVIDDLDMKITHVIRGEDHINNTPRQINIFKALGYSVPEYAHLSMILDNFGKKLSKRNHSSSIMKYREDGYLPEALLNYLVRLGWSYGDEEIFTIKEMINYFSLKNINNSPSRLDNKKLLWINHHYINSLSTEKIAVHLKWHLEHQGLNLKSGPILEDLIKLFRTRCKTLKEMVHFSWAFYHECDFDKMNFIKKYLFFGSNICLELAKKKFSFLQNWSNENVFEIIKEISTENNIAIKKINMLLRVMIFGKEQSPNISSMIYVMGKHLFLKRIDRALIYIKNFYKKIN